MRREVWIVAASLFAAGLFAASPAFAQADPDQPANAGAPNGDTNGGAGAGPSSTSSTATATAATGDLGGAPIIDRPLTLNAGKLGAYADLGILRASTTTVNANGTTMSSSTTSLGLHLGAGYGVNNDLTVGLEYAFSLANDFEIKGPLSLYGSYSVFHKDKLTIGVSGALIFDLNAYTVNADGTTSNAVDVSLSLGAGARYAITPSIAIYAGNGPGYGFDVTALDDVALVAPGILGSQLLIGFNNYAPIVFALPVGVAWQATPQVYAFAQTEIFDVVHVSGPTIMGIDTSKTNSNFLFADYIPLEIGGFYTVNKNLDVGAALNFGDLENGVDALAFTLSARYLN